MIHENVNVRTQVTSEIQSKEVFVMLTNPESKNLKKLPSRWQNNYCLTRKTD